jgi:hypothetical protein
MMIDISADDLAKAYFNKGSDSTRFNLSSKSGGFEELLIRRGQVENSLNFQYVRHCRVVKECVLTLEDIFEIAPRIAKIVSQFP